jgi:esterase/lipase superfamily enzyme
MNIYDFILLFSDDPYKIIIGGSIFISVALYISQAISRKSAAKKHSTATDDQDRTAHNSTHHIRATKQLNTKYSTSTTKISAKELTVGEQQHKYDSEISISRKNESAASSTNKITHQNDYISVDLFYATNRSKSLLKNPNISVKFGGNRGCMSYGTCQVSIPRRHKVGNLETPSIWKLELQQNPKKHIALTKVIEEQKERFFELISNNLEKTTKKDSFVFFHGYNVSFKDAARRAAQISYDLNFEGTPIFYSWPSKNLLLGYWLDEQTIEWAEHDIENFLLDLLSDDNLNNIYIIAHSMGNRAVTRVLSRISSSHKNLAKKIKEIILAAPDIDATVFKRDIAPYLTNNTCAVTLYASSKDKALRSSRWFHGYHRAGESGKKLVITPKIETIDASNVDTSFLGHSYFGDNRSILSDMFYLIGEGKRADFRYGLRKIDCDQGRHWSFKE